MLHIRAFVILLVVFIIMPSRQRASSDDSLVISILTCAPGQELYSIYGHNAIRVRDMRDGSDQVYNYGTFDFETPGFALKFMRGKLPYMVSVADFGMFMREYNYFKRSVSEQVINLSREEKVRVVEYLSHNMQPENRMYKYDFFMDNCATRLRDIIEKNTGGVAWNETKASGKTFRQIIKEYQKNLPWTDFGIDLIIGSPADRPATLREEAFIPDYLAQNIHNARLAKNTTERLEFYRKDIVTFPGHAPKIYFFLTPLFFFMVLLVAEAYFLWRKPKTKWLKYYDTIWVWLICMASLLMAFMWFGTDHLPTKYNWNLLWANILIPVWWWTGSRKNILFWIVGICLALSVINVLPGLNFLPQYFNPIIAVICVILMLKVWRKMTDTQESKPRT